MSNLLLTLFLLLQATMDEPSAVVRAVSLWGSIGHIGYARGPADTYWTKQVGYLSTGCQKDFTVLGSALNTWEDAFADATPNTVIGPYSGQLTLSFRAYDDVALESVQLRLDGSPLGPSLSAPLPQSSTPWDGVYIWNSATIANGVHNLCATAKDSVGNIGYGRPYLFRTDQSVTSISTVIRIP